MKNSSLNHFISKPSRAVFLALSTTVLVSACGEVSKSTQSSELTQQGVDVTAKTNDIKKSTFKPNELANLPSDSSAHWLTSDLLVLPKSVDKYQYQLLSRKSASFNAIDLSPTIFPEKLAAKFPHLAEFQAFKVHLTPKQAKHWLKQQLMVVAVDDAMDKNEKAQQVAYVQIGGVVDALYTQGGNDADEVTDLGATIIATQQGEGTNTAVSFKLWAPTAQTVSVQLFDDNLQAMSNGKFEMVEDTNTGVWQVLSDSRASYAYYQYQIDVYHPASKKIESLSVTDPYSLSLSVNSEY